MKSLTTTGVGVLLALTILSGPAVAHEIDGPTAVDADGAGHFYYEIDVIITSPIEFDYSELDGLDNTDLGTWVAEGFCEVVIDPGTYTIVIEGNLLDISFDGSVFYSHAMCDDWTGVITTAIYAPVVGSQGESWSAVKSLYR